MPDTEVSELCYLLSLSRVDGVGPTTAKSLIAYCGSAQNVFKEPASKLQKIPGIGSLTAQSIKKFKDFSSAEREIENCKKFNIHIVSYFDEEYPFRLRNTEDCPLVLFQKGNNKLNSQIALSIVGTRNSSTYGKTFVEQFLEKVRDLDIRVISGLASGTDTNVHRKCIELDIPTIGVLGHGFSTMYPGENRKMAEKMMDKGALLTEYSYYTRGNRENFPQRNRIVAGMCDALIVVESGIRGGSLITATLANDYNRDVFALPGKMTDEWSCGCNLLISNHKAAIIPDIGNLLFQLGLSDLKPQKTKPQKELFIQLTDEEHRLTQTLKTYSGIDEICHHTAIPVSRLTFLLLDLEFRGIVKALPGKRFELA